MSTLQREVYEAFRAINVPEPEALKAAASLAKRDVDVSDLKRDMVVVKWMLGVVLAMQIAMFVKVLVP